MTTTKNNEHKKLNFSSEREQSQVCLNSAEHEKNQGRKVLNVPNLRFPEFQGEWEKCILGDITENFNLRNKDKIQYPMFSVTNDRGFVPQSEQFEGRDMVGEDIKAYKIIHTNDFAYNPARINVGSIAMYTGEKPCMISSLYVCFKTTKEVNNEWLMQLLKTPKMNYYYNVNGEGGVRVYLFYPNFARIRMSIPRIEEQKKIAKLLNLIDERIATQNKIIDKLQSLIKGIADKLFQAARTTKPLLEFAPNITSGTDKSGSGTIPLYDSTGIIGTVKNASKKGNIVLVARVGTIGTVQYVNEPCGVSDNALIVEAGEMTKYIYHFLKTYNFTRITSGTTQPLITASSLKKAAIPTYDIESQTRIVLCLNGLEKKLDMAKQYLSDIAVMKQYLLRQMFI